MAKKDKFQQIDDVNAIEIEENEIDLLELLYRLIDKWIFIAVGAVAGAVLMFVYSFIIATPIYEATSKLYVLSSSDSALNLSDLQIGSYLTTDYLEVFDTWEVNEMVRQNLNLDYSYAQLQDMVAVENPSNTRILHIIVQSENPNEAAALANEYATVAQNYISDVMLTDKPSILSVALVPVNPVSPNKIRNIALGMLAGIVLVGGVLVVQFILDDKIKTDNDIRKYAGIPTLAVIPDDDMSNKINRRKSLVAKLNDINRRR